MTLEIVRARQDEEDAERRAASTHMSASTLLQAVWRSHEGRKVRSASCRTCSMPDFDSCEARSAIVTVCSSVGFESSARLPCVSLIYQNDKHAAHGVVPFELENLTLMTVEEFLVIRYPPRIQNCR